MVWGISFALYEHSVYDERLGRILNNNLAEHHVPTNRDVGAIEALWVEEEDDHVSAIGAKGIGEIGIHGRRRHRQCGFSCHRQTRSRSSYHARQAALTADRR